MLETLTVYAGAATAKHIIKCWAQDEDLLATAGGSLVDLLQVKVPGFLSAGVWQGWQTGSQRK